MEALAKLHGGAKHLLAKLHELVNTAGTFQVGGYGQEIHEMTEMRAGAESPASISVSRGRL